MAAPTLDAEVLVDERLLDMVEIQVLPVGDGRHGAALEVGDRPVAPSVHEVGEAVGKVLDDLEAVDHRGGSHLHVSGAELGEFGRIPPGGDAADAGTAHTRRSLVAG